MATPQYGAPSPPATARGDGGGETSRLVKGLQQQARRARSSGAGGGAGQPGRRKRALTARRYVALDELGLPETPQLPEDVRRNQDAAKQRTEELQGIFASRHSSECEALRARLEALDSEENTLRNTLSSLQRELDDANAERRAKEVNIDTIPGGALGGRASEAAGERLPVRPPPLAEIPDKPDRFSAASAASPASGAGSTAGSFMRRDTGLFMSAQNSNNNRPGNFKDNTMSPILTRRRAEARLREATAAHESSMSQMKNETAEIERRMHKQQIWMEQVNQQVLEAEIQKVHCRVRLDKAERRVKSLSRELSKAYENVVALLEERLRLEDAKARNEALIDYLNIIGRADWSNADAKARNEALIDYLNIIGRADWSNAVNFEDNKSELCRLLECCRKSSVCEEKLNVLVEESKQNELFVAEVQSRCQDLIRFNNELQMEWTKVPAALKESVFSRLPRGVQTPLHSFLHPVSAMQQAQDALAYIMEEMRIYAEMLTQVHDSCKKERRRDSTVVEAVKTSPDRSWHQVPGQAAA